MSFRLVLLAGCLTGSLALLPREATAQLNFDGLKSLFRGREPAPFAGMAELDTAYSQALSRDSASSLKSAREAFKRANRGAQLSDADSINIAARLLQLSHLWRQLGAPPKEVAQTLQEI